MWSEFLEKLGRFTDRRGHYVFLSFAFLYLVFPLARSGLWEPWEMDRADVARTYHEPSVIPTALDPSAAKHEVAAVAVEAADEAGVRLDYVQVPPSNARKVASLLPLTNAIQIGRTHIIGGMLVDLDLLVRPATQEADLKRVAPQLLKAVEQANGAHLILLSTAASEHFGERVQEAFTDAYWRAQANRYCVLCPKGDSEHAERMRQIFVEGAESLPPAPTDQLKVLVRPAQTAAGHPVAPDVGVLAHSLQTSANAAFGGAAFKKDGKTYSLPPLETWAISVAYQLFGYTEFATRFPGTLFAFLTLLLIMLVVRRIWDPRIALLTGLVLLTTPLFYAQAMSAVGETGAMLGLTMVAAGLMWSTDREDRHKVWALLAGGFLLLFLAKGLFGVLVALVIVASLPLLKGARDLASWRPAIIFGAITACLILLVQSAPADGAAGQFRFTQKLFSAGPAAYHLNFDLVVNQIGFGGFPWSPLYLLAIAGVLFSPKLSERPTLVLVLWFAIPTTVMMVVLSDFNQLLWPAAPAAAVLVAVFLAKLAREGRDSTLMALLLVLMALILARELGKGPRPLAGFLAFDPPFTESGSQRFPETVQLSQTVLMLYGLAIAIVVVHLTSLWTRTAKLRALFRKDLPYGLAVGAIVAAFGLATFLRAVVTFASGMESRGASILSAGQRQFPGQFLTSADPGVVLAWTLLGSVSLLFIARIIPFSRRKLGAIPNHPAFGRLHFVGLGLWVVLALIALASVVTPEGYWSDTLWGSPLLAILVGAGVVVAAARFPGRWLPPVRDTGVYVAGGLAIGLATIVLRDANLYTALGTFTQSGFGSVPLFASLTFLGAIFFIIPVVRKMWRDWASMTLFGGILVAVAFFLLAVPLIDRWDQMAETLQMPELGSYIALKSKLSWGVYLAVAFLISSRAFGATEWAARLTRVTGRAEHGLVAVGAMSCVALIFSVSTVFGFYSDVSLNVSQKHIIDMYRTAEGIGDGEIGDRIFRYGSFSMAGKKDSNFYTSAVPTIKDRKVALDVLLGEKDQTVHLQTSDGKREVRLVQGWNPANDQTGCVDADGEECGPDGKRDHQAIVGRISKVRPGLLISDTDSFKGLELNGFILFDAGGTRLGVTGNDASTVQVEDLELVYQARNGVTLRRAIPRQGKLVVGRRSPSTMRIADPSVAPRHAELRFKDGKTVVRDLGTPAGTLLNGGIVDEAEVKGGDFLQLGKVQVNVVRTTPSALGKAPGENFFVVDSPDSADHAATSMEERRSYLLLPSATFSDLNFRFRKRSKGRHVPILSGNSIRVLLAASHLRDGEAQENRYANHTLSRAQFDVLNRDDDKVQGAPPGRYLANFDDKVHVLGYRLEENNIKSGQKMKLRLYFECVADLKRSSDGCTGTSSFKVFMHIERHKTRNRINGDHWPLNLTKGGEKDKGCTGCYQTNHWLPGDVVVDVYEKEIPQGTQSGNYDMWFGFFNPGSKKRLPIKGADRALVPSDGANRVMVGSFRVP